VSTPAEFAAQVGKIAAGDPWYGDSIATITHGLSAREAALYPIAGAHSIWELVLHLTTWATEVRRRLADGVWREPADGDWPSLPAPTDGNWKRDLARLAVAHDDLRETIAAFPAARLSEHLGSERNRELGTGVTYSEMLHGILQHDAYHLGQISLLKRAMGER
jgi:uncharacterized damage-inducible protein DinB